MTEKRPELKAGDEYKLQNGTGRLQAKIAEFEDQDSGQTPRYYVTIKSRADKKGARWGKPVTISRQLFWKQVSAAV